MTAFGRKAAAAVLTIGVVLGGAACGDGGGGGGGGGATSSTFVGVVSSDDGLSSGSISVVIQTTTLAPPAATGPNVRAPANATGSLTFGGGSTSLSGSYDPDTDILALTGGGYTFGGGFDGVDRLEGIWSGPGSTSGTFVTTRSDNAVAFCGTYAADDQSDSGTFSFVIAGGTVRGEAYSSTDQVPIPLDGTISGNNITIDNPQSASPLATGTRNGNNVSGTYDTGAGGSGATGTWAGSVCQ